MSTTTEVQLAELAPLLSSAEWSSGPLFFVGDVGGTNARLGFARSAAQKSAVHIAFVRFSMTKRATAQLLEFFDAILSALRATAAAAAVLPRVVSGVLSVPGPVVDNAVGGPFNNLAGMARLAEYPAALFPPATSALLNDLESSGYGAVVVSRVGEMQQYFAALWEGSHWPLSSGGAAAGSALGLGNSFIVAPGTGLGTALVQYMNRSKSYLVLPLECGSASVAWSPGPKETYLRFLSETAQKDTGDADAKAARKTEAERGEETAAAAAVLEVPHWESTVAGTALQRNHVFEALRRRRAGLPSIEAPATPAAVAALAKQGDATAAAAVDRLYMNLMDFCAEATMSFLPLTVVLMGDSVVANAFYFENPENVARLQERLRLHPMERKFKFLSRTTFVRQTKKLSINLLGCYGFGAQALSTAAQPKSSHL